MEDNEKKGFTLIEILAVIVLIALIVIIAVPSVKSISAKSKRKLFDTKVRIAEEAVNMWAESNTSCFEEGNDGCGILDGCKDENGNRKCTVTFEKLASNGIIDYDLVEGDNKYVVDPTINESMNKYIIDVTLDKNTNLVISNFDESNDNNKVPEKIITTKRGETTKPTTKSTTTTKTTTTTKATTTTKTTTTTKPPTTTKPILCGSFKDDSWETIEYNVKNNYTYCYNVGDTKQVYINDSSLKYNSPNQDGYFTVRISNMSNPSKCYTEGFSQTACGFVVEFVDIVKKSKMMNTESTRGGWPNSIVRDYLNQEFFYKLPNDLQKVISNTYVKSLYSCFNENCTSKSNNGKHFESYDRLYLFTNTEVGRRLTYYGGITDNDYTRTTDYYSLTNNNASKNFWGRTSPWWLINPNGNTSWHYVRDTSSYGALSADTEVGVAPSFRINFIKSDINNKVVCDSFSKDSWFQIQQNIKNDEASCYKVGDTKQIFIPGFGYHNIKIVNKRTPTNCNKSGYSQTACGFVFAFDDILAVDYMNDGRTNTGSWNNSKARSVLNNTIYNALPSDLKYIISNTFVVSGWGSNDSTYFTSNDYLFLPSLAEIYAGLTNSDDNARTKTRQLDYYGAKSINGITGAIQITKSNMNSDNSMVNNPKKTYNSSNAWYWTRTPMPGTSDGFKMIDGEGYIEGNIANLNKYGLSPMFKVN